MKLKLYWFNIIELKKMSRHSFDATWVPIPLLELEEFLKKPKYMNHIRKRVYLGTYRKFTTRL